MPNENEPARRELTSDILVEFLTFLNQNRTETSVISEMRGDPYGYEHSPAANETEMRHDANDFLNHLEEQANT